MGKAGKKPKTGKNDPEEDQSDSSMSEGDEGKIAPKQSAFALLMDDDGSDGSGSDADSDEVEKEEEEEAKKAKAKAAEKSKKDKKNKKKAKKGDDDDVDEVAAAVAAMEVTEESEPKKAGGKKSKKKKRKEEDDEDLEAMMAELQAEAEGTKAPPTTEELKAEKEEEEEGKKKEKKKKKKAKDDKEDNEEDEDGEEDKAEEGGTVKTAAQKRKEKKERQKAKAAKAESKADKAASVEKEDSVEKDEAEAAGGDEDEGDAEGGEGKSKKKKKKGGEKEAKAKKGPGAAMKAAMQEALKKAEEEKERLRLEEEERERKEDEALRIIEERKQAEKDKREAKKQRERERKEQMKKEGTYMTEKQKKDKARAEASLAAMRAQGIEVPAVGEKKGPRLGTRIRPNKKDNNNKKSEEPEESVKNEAEKAEEPKVEIKDTEEIKAKEEPVEEVKDEVKDDWEMSSEEEEEEEVSKEESSKKSGGTKEGDSEEEEDQESSDEDDDEDDESSEDEDSEDDAISKRDRAISRIAERKRKNEESRTTDVLRAPVICVMGHVDTGKTKILDKLRRTNVQDGEAGGITQQIGTTNVPIDVIREQCKMVKGFDDVRLPGLLIIDTPGHESFSNLRDRGSSLCDMAILVVDVMHSLEPQTIESINLLKTKKTPFIIALNKVDRLYEWKSNRHKDIKELVDMQGPNTMLEFDKRSKEVIVGMAEQGLNAALYYENPDPKTYISMVPTSAHSGDGMGNLMALLVQYSQSRLAKKLAFSEEVQANVLEVKAIPGLGTTIDVVLVNGTLKEGNTMIVAGTDGPIVTPIKALLTPNKMQDLRVKVNYVEHKELRAAQGVKICAKELDKAIAGLNLLIANHPDEVELCQEEARRAFASVMNSIKTKKVGVHVQASTLGSLEALMEFLRTSKIPVAHVKIGPVVKRDVMMASAMLEHEEKYSVILAFDVKIERDAQEMSDNMGVKIFQADIIYHLFDRFTEYQDELIRKKREEFKYIAVFPCKLRVIPSNVFMKRDPIVCGVVVEAGVVKTGTPICVPSKDFIYVGIVTSLQFNNKEVDTARKGEEVCVKIDSVPGEAPKMFGRHFDETDFLVSRINRASIDACKNYFRDDLQKDDWKLMIELKKTFEIM